jgi:hypothetical protein
MFRYWIPINMNLAYQGQKKKGFDYLPARGELGGESTAAEDPARTAEYTTDKTVVTNPKVREPVETAFECL